MNGYIHTDLASEIIADPATFTDSDIKHSEETIKNIRIERVEVISEHGSEQLGKPQGHYITMSFGKVWEDEENEDNITEVLADELAKLMKLSDFEDPRILVVGLGNRNITSDSLGPVCVDGIIVTKHLIEGGFITRKLPSVAAMSPGVLSQTGIETFELIRSAMQTCQPTQVIVVDALASRSVDRLATTIQLTDTGITPGSGIGNNRHEISMKTLGVPVIAIGVPCVVSSSTLVYEAIEKAGIKNIDENLKSILENGKSFFVTLKDADEATEKLSELICISLNNYFFAGNKQADK